MMPMSWQSLSASWRLHRQGAALCGLGRRPRPSPGRSRSALTWSASHTCPLVGEVDAEVVAKPGAAGGVRRTARPDGLRLIHPGPAHGLREPTTPCAARSQCLPSAASTSGLKSPRPMLLRAGAHEPSRRHADPTVRANSTLSSGSTTTLIWPGPGVTRPIAAAGARKRGRACSPAEVTVKPMSDCGSTSRGGSVDWSWELSSSPPCSVASAPK
jgi:hypothetical protein